MVICGRRCIQSTAYNFHWRDTHAHTISLQDHTPEILKNKLVIQLFIKDFREDFYVVGFRSSKVRTFLMWILIMCSSELQTSGQKWMLFKPIFIKIDLCYLKMSLLIKAVNWENVFRKAGGILQERFWVLSKLCGINQCSELPHTQRTSSLWNWGDQRYHRTSQSLQFFPIWNMCISTF